MNDLPFPTLGDLWDRVRDWVRERRSHLNLFDETLVARQDNPIYLMGPLLYYFWLITVISGFLLMIWYEPTTNGAYSSIERIQYEIGRFSLGSLVLTVGGLIRGLHKYAADGHHRVGIRSASRRSSSMEMDVTPRSSRSSSIRSSSGRQFFGETPGNCGNCPTATKLSGSSLQMR